MYSSIYLSKCGAGFLIHFRILSASLLPESNAPCTVPDEDNKDGPYININCEIEKSISVFGEGATKKTGHKKPSKQTIVNVGMPQKEGCAIQL